VHLIERQLQLVNRFRKKVQKPPLCANNPPFLQYFLVFFELATVAKGNKSGFFLVFDCLGIFS